MRRRELIGTAGLLGLTGCLRMSGTGESTATTIPETTTVRETETTETTTQTPDSATYPQGLSSSGIDDFLFPTHVDTLKQTSFRATWAKLDVRGSVTKWQKEYRSDTHGAMGTWRRQEGGPVAMYRNWDAGYWRESLGDRVTYGRDPPLNNGHDPTLWGVELQPLLAGLEWGRPTRTNDSRPAQWEVSASSVVSTSEAPGYHVGSVISVDSATVSVDERGFIPRVQARYTIQEDGGEEIEYEIRYRVGDIGQVSVQEPTWLPKARSEVPEVDATMTDDSRAVRLEIVSGNRLEPGTTVFIMDVSTDTAITTHLSEPFPTGTPVYAYHSRGDPATQLSLSTDGPPAGEDVTVLDGDFRVLARRGPNQYFSGISV